MKKKVLFLAALFAVSTGAMAANVNGHIGSKIEVVDQSNDDDWEYQEVHWITHGHVKPENWKNFELAYAFRKDNSDEEEFDHAGYTNFEFIPKYNTGTSWGSIGGQVNFLQERFWTPSTSGTGADSIKPELWGTYNLTDYSHIFARGMYESRQTTGVEDTEGYAEVEVQYRHDIFGGTAMGGAFYAPGVDETDSQEARLLGNFAKWWPSLNIFTVTYADIREVTLESGDKINSYKASLYANTPIKFIDGLVLEGEINRFAEIENEAGALFAENFMMVGVTYNF